MKKNLAFSPLLFFLLLNQVFAGEIVKVKGMSFFEPGREAIAREKALADAKRTAVEQAVGVHIDSRSMVENFHLSRDQVLSHASGYIRSMKIMQEKKTELGTYEVELEAEVEIADLISDMDRFEKVLGWQKNPRVAVLLYTDINKEFLPAARKASGQLSARLKRDGFRVFTPEAASHNNMGLIVRLNIELFSTESDYQGVTLNLHEISLNADIFRPGEGEILASSSAVKSMPGVNKLQVLDKGTKLCLNDIWPDLRQQLTVTWEAELYSQRAIDLVLTNVPSYARAIEISDIFRSDVSNLADIQLISFENQSAKYSIQYKGWPEHLINELEMNYFRKKYFETSLNQISGNRITMNII